MECGRKDGRYKFARTFAPPDHNRPADLDQLFGANDLYDLQSDPHGTTTLALDRARNAELLLAMNAELERLIKAEIGVDDGRHLPKLEGINWALERMD